MGLIGPKCDKTCLQGFQRSEIQTIEISLVPSLDMILSKKQITKVLISLRRWAGWSAALLFANPEERFFRIESRLIQTSIIFTLSEIFSHLMLDCFMHNTPPQVLSSHHQLLACIYGVENIVNLISEASHSGSTLFSHQDVSVHSMVRVNSILILKSDQICLTT